MKGHDSRPGTWTRRRVSPWLLGGFRRYVRTYMARHFHSVRLHRTHRPEDPGDRPLIVVLNHPSWWDPLLGALLAAELFPDREHHAPIEARALERYPLLERLGLFGIETGTTRGGRRFLEVGRAVLDRPRGTLWVTAQGRFADPRARPVRLLPGVGHLARRLDRGLVLPLALEFPFWEERLPEALARFGEPLPVDGAPSLDRCRWTERIGRALESTQEALAIDSIERRAAEFDSILAGRVGVGRIYDAGRRLIAALRGRPFRSAHGEIVR